MLPKVFNVTGNCSSDDQSYNYKSGKKKDCDNRSHRSQSEPPKHLKNGRGCPRANEDFCSEATNTSHNSMKVLAVGVDPRQIGPQQCTASCCADHNSSGSKQRQQCTASCCADHNGSGSKQRQQCTASCCADHNGSGSKQRQQCTASCCADHNGSGSKQRQWMAQQQAQQQMQRQQQMQQMQQQPQNCYNTFQPNMNSTMMPQQQQQQKKCCPQPAARPLTAHERSHARQECCAAQQQQQKYPSKSPRAGNAQQYEVCSSFEQSSNYKGCNQSQAKQASCCQQRATSPTAMQREVTFNHASGSCAACQTTVSRKPNPCSTLRPDKLPANMSPEELYVQRANTLFMEMLVLDRTYPGVIQETLDGHADFNDLSFQIAFAGKIPSKPCPMEPISLLEAIQMRIDYERDEIERKIHIHEEEEKPECRKDKEKEKPRGMYYAHEDKMNKASSHRSHAGCSKCGHAITDEDIDRHFAMKNKSEVNTAVRAFIKAQNNHKNEESLFAANINSHECDFFGAPIKMKVYNGTTWPIN